MIQITENIVFDENKSLKEQTPGFQQWISENILAGITLATPVEKRDETGRPEYYTMHTEEYSIVLTPVYINNKNMAVKDYILNIKSN